MEKDTNTTDGLAVDSVSAGSIPALRMTHNEQGDYGVLNWQEVDDWGYMNHPLWNRVRQTAEHHGWDEVTKLKLLADALMRQNVELTQTCIEIRKQLPIPPISIKPNRQNTRKF